MLAGVAWLLLGVLAYRWHRKTRRLKQERDHALDLVEAGRRRFLSVATNSKEAMIVIDVEGHVLLWNRGAEKLFGRTAREMIGQSLHAIMPERHWEAHQKALARLKAGGAPRLMEQILRLEALDRSGVEFPIELGLAQYSDVDEPGHGDWTYIGIIRKVGGFQKKDTPP